MCPTSVKKVLKDTEQTERALKHDEHMGVRYGCGFENTYQKGTKITK